MKLINVFLSNKWYTFQLKYWYTFEVITTFILGNIKINTYNLYKDNKKKHIMMLNEIIKYKTIVESIPKLMENSPYKKSYIVKESGINPPTFYRKLRKKSFTPDEVLRIVKILNPKEAYLIELKEGLEKSKQQYENGEIMTHEQVKERVKNNLKR